MERGLAEIELLRERYPELECRESGWCRLPRYRVPEGWSASEVELAFRVPENIPAEVPYGFWTRPMLTLASGAPPSNTSGPIEILGLGSGWWQWSWQLEGWQPGPTPREGTNVADHVRSIASRLRELD